MQEITQLVVWKRQISYWNDIVENNDTLFKIVIYVLGNRCFQIVKQSGEHRIRIEK
jgi:hypothetical protein